jgi:hypothetical protein
MEEDEVPAFGAQQSGASRSEVKKADEQSREMANKAWEEEKKRVLTKPEKFEELAKKLLKIDIGGVLKKIIVRGYASRRGELEDNLNLSVARAKWVKDALTKKYRLSEDIPIQIVGCGEFHASDSEDDDDQDDRVATLELLLDEASVLPEGFPNAPEDLKAKIVDNKKVELEWKAVEGARGYNLYWSKEFNITSQYKTHKDQLDKELDIKEPKYVHDKIIIDRFTGLYYLVTAVNETGESFPSNTARVGLVLESEDKVICYYHSHYTHDYYTYEKEISGWYVFDGFTGKKKGPVPSPIPGSAPLWNQMFDTVGPGHWEPHPGLYRAELRLDLNTDIPKRTESPDEIPSYPTKEALPYRIAENYHNMVEIINEGNTMIDLMLEVIGRADRPWFESKNRKEDLLSLKTIIGLWIPTVPSRLPLNPDKFYIQERGCSDQYEEEVNEKSMTIGFFGEEAKATLNFIKEMNRDQGELVLDPAKGDLIVQFKTNEPS